jgi:hypothetical protein
VTPAVVLAGVAAVAAPVPAVVRAEPLPAWSAKFAGGDWLGADGAYSVPVSADRTVWLFGDTFVGKLKDGTRAGSAMVNNTVGVQTGTGKAARLAFPIRRNRDGKPLAQFAPADGNGYFWPQAGLLEAGKLHLFLSRVEDTGQGGAFGFRQFGQALGLIENPADDPLKWTVEEKAVPFGEYTARRFRSWGSAVLADGGWVYVYGYEEVGKGGFGSKALTVARVPAGKLADFGAWRFLRGGKWQEGDAGPDHLVVGVASEFSVTRLGPGRYVLVTTDGGLGDRIAARFGRTPAGPWSKPLLLYKCPEMTGDKGVFCYSAKAHPHLAAGDNELVVGYCVNAWELARAVNDAAIYWPRFVRVTLK